MGGMSGGGGPLCRQGQRDGRVVGLGKAKRKKRFLGQAARGGTATKIPTLCVGLKFSGRVYPFRRLMAWTKADVARKGLSRA